MNFSVCGRHIVKSYSLVLLRETAPGTEDHSKPISEAVQMYQKDKLSVNGYALEEGRDHENWCRLTEICGPKVMSSMIANKVNLLTNLLLS